MQKQKQNRALGVVLLALAVCITGLVPTLTAAAVNTVDTTKTCTLTVSLPADPNDPTAYDDLKAKEFTANLYFVAPMNQDGSIGPASGAFTGVDLSAYKSDATAQALETLAGELEQAAQSQTNPPAPDKEITINGGASGQITGLRVGLYLLLPETVNFGSYEYQFAPIMMTLPTTETIKDPAGQDLYNLVYNASVFLKPERVDLFGILCIEKTLSTYRADLGPASFVFEITAKKTVNGQPQTVYSNTVEAKFSAPGVQTIEVEKVPAGTEVTVTEVYSGAAYVLKTDRTQTIAEMPANTAPDKAATVSFINDYENGQGFGRSVVNHYTYKNNPGSPAWTAPQNPSQGNPGT